MLADASIGKIYFLNMWDDSAFRTYYGRMVWYIIYDDSSSTYIDMIAYLNSSHDNSTCAYCYIISDDRYSCFFHCNGNTMIDGAIVSYLGSTIDDGGVAMDRAEAFANVWRQSHGTDFWQQYIEQVSWVHLFACRKGCETLPRQSVCCIIPMSGSFSLLTGFDTVGEP